MNVNLQQNSQLRETAVICWLRIPIGKFHIPLPFIFCWTLSVSLSPKLCWIRTLSCSIAPMLIRFLPEPFRVAPTSCWILPKPCCFWRMLILLRQVSCWLLQVSIRFWRMPCWLWQVLILLWRKACSFWRMSCSFSEKLVSKLLFFGFFQREFPLPQNFWEASL